MSKAVLGIARNRIQTEAVVEQLHEIGFSYHDVSVLFPDKESSHNFTHEKSTKAPEGAAAGAGAGGVVGGTLGLLAGIGLLAIPGLGPLVAAGPIMAALSGLAVGATVGGLAGALIGLGIPEYEARIYEGKLKEGNILIAVHTETQIEVERATKIMEQTGVKDISAMAEVGSTNYRKRTAKL